jgi:hypothetical protein
MLKEKLPIFLINTLLLHIPLLAIIDRQNYRGTKLQRNEYTCCVWAGGTFFFSCAVVSDFGTGRKMVLVLFTMYLVVLLCQFLVLAGNMFWFYILLLMYLEYNTVKVLC